MTNTLDRTRQEIDRLLTDSTVLHAVVGAGDLAVAKLRQTHSELSARTDNFDPKIIREQARATLFARVGTMPQDIKAAPQQVRALPEKVEAVIGDAVVKSFSAYGDLAGRGRTLVERVRKQPETADVREQAQTIMDLSEPPAGAPTKAAAKSRPATTKKAASARRTTTAARKSFEAGADKVGEQPAEPPQVSPDS